VKLIKALSIFALISTMPLACTIGDIDEGDDFWSDGGDDGGVLDASQPQGGKKATGGSGGKAGASGKGGTGGAAGKAGSAASGGKSDTAGSGGEKAAGGAGGGEGALPEIEDVAYGLAIAKCGALEDCLGPDVLAYGMNGEDCSKMTGGVWANRDLVYLADSVDKGRVIFRPETFSQCLADIRAQKCDIQNSRRPASCKSVLEGKVELDARCSIDEDCKGDAFCDRGTDLSICPNTPPICKELISEGNSGCRVDDNCKEGFTCESGTCRRFYVENESCISDKSECKPGLTCFEAACTPNSEIWKATEGQPCDPNNSVMCQTSDSAPLSCVQQPSGSANTAICQKRVNAGEACRGAFPSQCPSGQYCNAAAGQEGVCTNLPGQGEDCRPAGSSGKTQRCAAGYQCEENNKCYQINDNEYSCKVDAGCFSGICSSSDRCQPPPLCFE
jgi:hypothetical protein